MALIRRSLLNILLAALTAGALSSCQTPASESEVRLFDTHAHFYTNDFDRYPIGGTGLYSGVEAIRERMSADPKTPENTLPLWDANNIVGGAGVQYFTAYGYDNRYTVDAADADPRRITAVVVLDARDPSTPAALRDMVERRRVVTGIRITGFADDDGGFGWLDSDAALNTWTEANRLRLAVVVMLGRTQDPAEGARRIGELARRFPNVNIVLDHVGQPLPQGAPAYGISAEFAALSALPNVYYKLTTLNFERLAQAGVPADGFVRHVVDTYGADHVMWGSDFGNSQGTLESMVRTARDATALLSARERRQVLLETGRRIFGPRS